MSMLETMDDIETVEPVAETPEPTADGAPKRGRGRPRKTESETPASSGARRRVGRVAGKAVVAAQCQTLIGLGNMLVIARWPLDALTEPEMKLAADAITDECMSIERVRIWMTTAAKITPHIALISAAVIIAMPRLARRGIIPANMSPDAAAFVAPETEDIPDSEPAGYATDENETYAEGTSAAHQAGIAVPVGTRRAFDINGRYGQR